MIYALGNAKNKKLWAEDYDKEVVISEQTTWPGLLKETGVFKSTSEAIRNGFEGNIPSGYHCWTIGKMKRLVQVFMWNKGDKKYGKCICQWCKGE